MKDRRQKPLTLFALFLLAYIVIGNQWEPTFKSTSPNEDGRNLREKGGKAANNNLVGDTTGSIASSGSSGDSQEGQVTISEKQLTYRYPRTFSATMSDSNKNTELVVGVLSAAGGNGVSRRKVIRNTWSKDHKGRVYFVVAGNWSNIEKEFEEDQDLIWVDMEEKWWHLTYKVQTFYHAVENHFGLPYDYIMKTDDDSYVFLPALDSFLKKYDGDLQYGGYCVGPSRVIRRPGHRYYVPKWVYSPNKYPPYAMGDGYFVSKDFNKCLLDHIAKIDYLPMEDCATGLLAEKCNSHCVSTHSVFKENLKHGLKDPHWMQEAHEQYMGS